MPLVLVFVFGVASPFQVQKFNGRSPMTIPQTAKFRLAKFRLRDKSIIYAHLVVIIFYLAPHRRNYFHYMHRYR